MTGVDGQTCIANEALDGREAPDVGNPGDDGAGVDDRNSVDRGEDPVIRMLFYLILDAVVVELDPRVELIDDRQQLGDNGFHRFREIAALDPLDAVGAEDVVVWSSEVMFGKRDVDPVFEFGSDLQETLAVIQQFPESPDCSVGDIAAGDQACPC